MKTIVVRFGVLSVMVIFGNWCVLGAQVIGAATRKASQPPQVSATVPAVPSTNWFTSATNLSVTASTTGNGFSSLRYQWSRNGIPVPDAIEPQYFFLATA